MSSTAIRPVNRYRNGAVEAVDDYLVVEEPLEIRVGDRSFTVTMRTPGDDFDLARGLLFTEGLIRSASDIGQMRYCEMDPDQSDRSDPTDPTDNILKVRLTGLIADGRQWQRNLMSGSSCGLCGKAALEAVTATVAPIQNNGCVSPETLLRLPDMLRERQPVFTQTGGLHAAGIFSQSGECLAAFEDIGRHNATDKVIGRGVLEGWIPWTNSNEALILLVSGRASFEITQKALVAGIPVVASVSAASSLAVDLAARSNMSLIGFLRGTGMTVYTGMSELCNHRLEST